MGTAWENQARIDRDINRLYAAADRAHERNQSGAGGGFCLLQAFLLPVLVPAALVRKAVSRH